VTPRKKSICARDDGILLGGRGMRAVCIDNQEHGGDDPRLTEGRVYKVNSVGYDQEGRQDILHVSNDMGEDHGYWKERFEPVPVDGSVLAIGESGPLGKIRPFAPERAIQGPYGEKGGTCRSAG
jgi:hypothetical protein